MAHAVSLRPSILAFCALLAASLALTGCGRRGPLELPPDVPPTPASQAADAAQAARPGPVVTDPGLLQPPDKIYQVPAAEQLQQAAQGRPRSINGPPAPKPGKPFILDPLL